MTARDEDGNTPLHAAAAAWLNRTAYFSPEDYIDIDECHNGYAILLLLDAGADATARNAAGLTPWHVAEENEALHKCEAYLRLNETRF